MWTGSTGDDTPGSRVLRPRRLQSSRGRSSGKPSSALTAAARDWVGARSDVGWLGAGELRPGLGAPGRGFGSGVFTTLRAGRRLSAPRSPSCYYVSRYKNRQVVLTSGYLFSRPSPVFSLLFALFYFAWDTHTERRERAVGDGV